MTDLLRAHGLQPCGHWTRSHHASVAHLRAGCEFGLAFHLETPWPLRRHVVYAFEAGETILYIGETSAGMAARFAGYRYGNPLVRDTDNRIKLALTQALRDQQSVRIWAAQPEASLQLPNGETLCLPAHKALEVHLIERVQPALNVKDRLA